MGLVLFAYKGRLAMAAICMGVFALLLGWPNAWLTRRNFSKSPFFNDEIDFSVSESGTHVVSRDSEVRLGWSNYTGARRFKDGLLLFQGPRVFNWLPDTAAADASSIAAVQELARAHIRDYRDL